MISSLFGGRIAEELTLGFDGVTTGASNDIERATKLARAMVTKWGLSEKLGPLAYEEDEGEVFLGKSVTQSKHVSEQTAEEIDREVRAIIDMCYGRARTILEENRDKLEAMAQALMLYETIDADQIDDVMNGKPPRPPKDWGNDDTPNASGGAASGDKEESSPKRDGDQPLGGPANTH
jgi:cell division protease FtsH